MNGSWFGPNSVKFGFIYPGLQPFIEVSSRISLGL
jgi:hypothetical protein